MDVISREDAIEAFQNVNLNIMQGDAAIGRSDYIKPDNVCPCQCDDGWYNWYPSDDFYCGRAERREDALN